MVYRYTLIFKAPPSANQQRPFSWPSPQSRRRFSSKESSVDKEEDSDTYARTCVVCIWLLYVYTLESVCIAQLCVCIYI